MEVIDRKHLFSYLVLLLAFLGVIFLLTHILILFLLVGIVFLLYAYRRSLHRETDNR